MAPTLVGGFVFWFGRHVLFRAGFGWVTLMIVIQSCSIDIFLKRGLTFYLQFLAAGAPPMTDFLWVLAGFFTIRDPRDIPYHSFTRRFGALL